MQVRMVERTCIDGSAVLIYDEHGGGGWACGVAIAALMYFDGLSLYRAFLHVRPAPFSRMRWR